MIEINGKMINPQYIIEVSELKFHASIKYEEDKTECKLVRTGFLKWEEKYFEKKVIKEKDVEEIDNESLRSLHLKLRRFHKNMQINKWSAYWWFRVKVYSSCGSDSILQIGNSKRREAIKKRNEIINSIPTIK